MNSKEGVQENQHDGPNLNNIGSPEQSNPNNANPVHDNTNNINELLCAENVNNPHVNEQNTPQVITPNPQEQYIPQQLQLFGNEQIPLPLNHGIPPEHDENGPIQDLHERVNIPQAPGHGHPPQPPGDVGFNQLDEQIPFQPNIEDGNVNFQNMGEINDLEMEQGNFIDGNFYMNIDGPRIIFDGIFNENNMYNHHFNENNDGNEEQIENILFDMINNQNRRFVFEH